jgi:alkylation response protein AidB-like acyl-CoA dehydrogenase
MDFAWNEEQSRWYQDLAAAAREDLNIGLAERDRAGEFNRAGWQRCADLGVQGLPIPERYGGRGVDGLCVAHALEGLGNGCRDNGLLMALHAHMWSAAMPLLAFGTEKQKERYLPRLCNGQFISGNAMTEPESGSDAFSMTATAKRKGESYILNGRKMYITNGPIADVLIVFASVDPSKAAHGITAFLVDKGTPGFMMSPPQEKAGLRTTLMGHLTLEECEVPAANLLGKEGAGLAVFTHAMEWERAFILATAVGTMERLLDICIRYSKQRKQFGKPIGKFQLVASKIVDMKMRLETSRGLLYRVAWQKSQGRFAMREAAMAKLHISECWVQCCLDAMQLHGGRGYMVESEFERELRDALGSRIYSGTSEIQRQIIAQFMGL